MRRLAAEAPGLEAVRLQNEMRHVACPAAGARPWVLLLQLAWQLPCPLCLLRLHAQQAGLCCLAAPCMLQLRPGLLTLAQLFPLAVQRWAQAARAWRLA